MYENDYMYAIERSPEYLAHYGIRGMKWGVRKAIASGNSAKLGKQYAKAQKKLAKLEKQAGKSKKYARRAALLGAGAAAAGGLAAAGTSGVGKLVWQGGRYAGKAGKAVGQGMVGAGQGLIKAGMAGHNGRIAALGSNIARAGSATKQFSGKIGRGAAQANIDITKWGNSNSIGQAMKVGGRKLQNAVPGNVTAKLTGGKGIVNTTDKLGGVTNNTFARIGAGAIGAGLAVGAARNAYKAATAKKKAEKFRAAMNESFKGTKYANGGGQTSKPRQGKKRRR